MAAVAAVGPSFSAVEEDAATTYNLLEFWAHMPPFVSFKKHTFGMKLMQTTAAGPFSKFYNMNVSLLFMSTLIPTESLRL